MLLNYIKIAFRNIIKHKGYSAVNILGLSAGLTCVILISMIIRNELSFDKFNKKAPRIYRVTTENIRDGKIESAAPVMIPFAPAAQAEIPEIEQAVRISQRSLLVSSGDTRFYEDVVFVDDQFFNVFTYPLIQGDAGTVLKQPNTVVLSQRMSEKYFGESNPVGQMIMFDNKDLFRVTGVVSNIPNNSHMRGDIFASFNSYNESNFPRFNDWFSFSNDYTYILLKQNVDPFGVEKKLNAVLKSHTGNDYDNRMKMKVQPLTEIHFSDMIHDNARTTSVVLLYVFGAVAAFILIIGCINFINLTTARSARRNKEIGIRKTVGANRSQLIKQFISESFVITSISFVLAFFFSAMLLDQVNFITQQNFSFSVLFDFSSILIFIGIFIVTGFVSGAYPAFVLSNARPVTVLKNSPISRRNGYSLRAALVVLQFAISVFLIIGTVTVFRQTDYLLTRDLGFASDRILVLVNNDEKIRENGLSFKRALLSNDNIIAASFSNGTPGSNSSRTNNFTPEGGSERDEIIAQIMDVDYDFLQTYGLKMTEGRFFSRSFTTDTSDAYILNESAVKKIGWQNAVGKRIAMGSNEAGNKLYNVVGVMQDFNYASLKYSVMPVIFRLKPGGGSFLSLQLKTENIASTMDFIKQTSTDFSPSYPYEFFFIKERFEKYYKGVSIMGKLLGVFSLLAILISCVGILGLVSFSTEQKSKEIGVRKVLGASIGSIVFMLCKEFVKWVLIANVIVWPMAYLAMKSFLNGFAYRIELSSTIFAVTLLVSVIITVMTVGFHSVKAAIANPVDSLRYE